MIYKMIVSKIQIEKERHQLNIRKRSIQSELIWNKLDKALEDEKKFNIKPNQLAIDKSLSQLRIKDKVRYRIN